MLIVDLWGWCVDVAVWSKDQAFQGQLSGRVPPPSSVRHVLPPPPYPGFRWYSDMPVLPSGRARFLAAGLLRTPIILVRFGFGRCCRESLKGGTLTRGNDIRVTPGMTVRWRSAPCAPPLYCHALVTQILVVPEQRRWCGTRVTVRVSRHHCGQTLYLSPGVEYPPFRYPPLRSPRCWVKLKHCKR